MISCENELSASMGQVNSTETGSTSRSFNSKNQISSYGGSFTITYDHDGNMTTDRENKYEFSDQSWRRI